MIITDYVKPASLRFIIVFAMAEMLFGATYFSAHSQQVLRFDSPNSCDAQGGTITGINLITDFANGTFGEEPSGAQNQSPTVNPFPGLITGGNYVPFFSPAFGFGDYAILSNAFEPRNAFQHREITDPLNGVTGRFFGSDPDNDMAPTLNFTITNVVPNENFELSFWAANSEPNGNPNVLVAVIDGIESFSTGPLPAFPAALEWRRHAFVFNAGDRTTIELSIASTIDGTGGLDFYVDNIELQGCTLVGAGGMITGTVFGDSNSNDVFDTGTDGPLAGISVQLWDTQGDSDPSNDVFVSVTASDGSGLYQFQNIAAGNDYSVRVVVNDPNLPTGAVPGTPVTLGPFAVTNSNTTGGQDFGFDLTEAALEAFKTVELFDPDTFAVPSNDVVYAISIINRGDGPVTNDSVFLIDKLPDEVIFFNDPLAPAIGFTQSGTGLTFDSANDVRYALAGPQPANFGACTYTPAPGYDPLVGFVCLNPKGEMAAGTPDPAVTFSFRARLR